MPSATLARALALVACTLILFSGMAQGSGSSPPLGPVYIQPEPFLASVPHEMILGSSYKLVIIVVNNGTSSASGSIVISFPQDYFFTYSAVDEYSVLPGDIGIFNFTVVPTDVNSSPMTISLLLVPSGGLSPQPTQRLNATVNSISRAHIVQEIPLYAGILGIVVLVLVALFLSLRRPARRSGPPSTPVGESLLASAALESFRLARAAARIDISWPSKFI